HWLRPADPTERDLADAFRRLAALKDDLVAAEAVRLTAQALPSLPADAPLPPAVSAQLLALVGNDIPEATVPPATAGTLRRALALASGLPAAEAQAVAARRAEDGSRHLADVIADQAKRIGFLKEQRTQEGQARQHDSR